MIKRVLIFFVVSLLISATVSALMVFLGIGNYLAGGTIQYRTLMSLCLLWSMIGSFASLMMSKLMAKWLMKVRIISKAEDNYKLIETVHHLAKQAGLTKMPDVGIYQSNEVNAFATGPSRHNALVAVSSGLLVKMNHDEIEGVLGHEISHIANGDMVTMALVQGVINAFVMFFARVAAFTISQALRNNNRDEPINPFVHMLIVFALDIFFGILATPIVAWFSRYREFRADRGGASLAGREKMIGALQALQKAYSLMAERQSRTDPNFKAMQISSKNGIFKLFSTHPSLEERITALRKKF